MSLEKKLIAPLSAVILSACSPAAIEKSSDCPPQTQAAEVPETKSSEAEKGGMRIEEMVNPEAARLAELRSHCALALTSYEAVEDMTDEKRLTGRAREEIKSTMSTYRGFVSYQLENCDALEPLMARNDTHMLRIGCRPLMEKWEKPGKAPEGLDDKDAERFKRVRSLTGARPWVCPDSVMDSLSEIAEERLARVNKERERELMPFMRLMGDHNDEIRERLFGRSDAIEVGNYLGWSAVISETTDHQEGRRQAIY